MGASFRLARQPGPAVIEGILATTLDAVERAARARCNGPLVVSDLSLGAWRSPLLARELCAQLGVALEDPPSAPESHQPRTDALAPYADAIGAAIDAEGAGDRAMLRALELATRIVAALKDGPHRPIVILAPRFGLPWEIEDELFLRFLAQGLEEGPHRLLLVVGPEEPILPRGCTVRWSPEVEGRARTGGGGLLALVPGLVEVSVLEALEARPTEVEGTHVTGSGARFVPPEWRRPPSILSRVVHDRLAVAARGTGWLHAYALVHGHNLYVDPLTLRGEAWQCAAAGGHDIALRFLARALECARAPEERALCLVQVQGMLIGLQRFSEAAATPDPPPSIHGPLRGLLLQGKAWGLIMSDEAARAEPYLRQARDLLQGAISTREYLYLLNISALAQLKLGDQPGAFELERRIETELATLPKPDWQLRYVNSLNIARLCCRALNVGEARHYYTRAFDTLEGVRSESDAVYANMCSARVSTLAAEPEAALTSWARACLHWLASRAPEALAPRVAGSLLGRMASLHEDMPEAFSAALSERLVASANAAGLTLPSVCANPLPAFARIEDVARELPAGAIYMAAGAPGWSILLCRAPISPAFSGPQHDQLRALLLTHLEAWLPPGAFAGCATVLVDDRFGRELPSTKRELLEVCLRLGIPRLLFDGSEQLLEDGERERLVLALRLRRAHAVDTAHPGERGIHITFRRYRPPLFLTGPASRLIAEVEDEPTVGALAERLEVTASAVLRWARELEHARVLELELPD